MDEPSQALLLALVEYYDHGPSVGANPLVVQKYWHKYVVILLTRAPCPWVIVRKLMRSLPFSELEG